MSDHGSAPLAREGGGIKGTIGSSIIVFSIVGAMFYFYLTRERTPEAVNTPQTTTTQTPAPMNTAQVMTEEWKPCRTKRDFRDITVRAEGTPVYLCPGWKTFPMGGAITITNSDGREIVREAPGENPQIGYQPAGVYTLRADPVGSERTVKIFNSW